MSRRDRARPVARRSSSPASSRAMLAPLGALAAGFGFAGLSLAQTAPAPAETVLPEVKAKAAAEPTGKETLQATQTRIGKGKQDLRDIPQSVTVVTEKLIDDRNLDTLKQALHNTAGITFQAAEGGEEDIRIRGFSLATTGDLYIDGMRDPALYERDTFNNDRVEVLRGSASMLFGRGSTGGVVNQVSKQPLLIDQSEVAVTLASGDSIRATADLSRKTGDDAALRINVMGQVADNWGAKIDKKGVAPSFRWGIGTADEFSVGLYHLDYDNVPNYGIGWVSGTIADIPAKNYHGMASDYMQGSATYGSFSHTHRFEGGGELKTALREGHFKRDFWASTIRFPNGTTAANLNGSTVINRGNQGRAHEYVGRYAQSDYSGKANWLGLRHELLAGADVAREDMTRLNYTNNPGKPTTTVGTPNDGASLPDTRTRVWNRSFEATALGAYVQDMLHLTPTWKLVGGLRYDHFKGDYERVPTTQDPNTNYARTDALWSRRFGVLYQPTALASFHFSYGTSFNTSGDTYNYDPLGANTPPEKSRNLELGAKVDTFDGNLSTRVALFRSEKYNERNTDPDTAAEQYLLSGKRHASGVELDLAGRITQAWELFASYAWTPVAKIDRSTATAGELEGSRPGLTPRHSGSLWTTYQLTPKLRVGGGLNAQSSTSPVGNANVYAPRYVIADLMAEYDLGPVYYKLNVTNVTDKLYGDQLYRGHAVAGAPRTVALTIGARL